MNLSFVRWQIILFAVITSFVSIIEQDKTEAEVKQQGRLTVMQMQFIDRFEIETEGEFELDQKIMSRTLCDARLHYNKHKSFVERWEGQMIPPSSEYPRRQIWADMWKAGEEFAKPAYAMKKEGVRFNCGVFESEVIEEVWEIMQNRTLKITTDPPDAVRAMMRQFFVTSLRFEIGLLWKHRTVVGISEDIKGRLENAKKVFNIDPFEVTPR